MLLVIVAMIQLQTLRVWHQALEECVIFGRNQYLGNGHIKVWDGTGRDKFAALSRKGVMV